MSNLAIRGGPKAVTDPIKSFQSFGETEKQAAIGVIENDILSGFHGSPRETFFGGKHVLSFEQKWQELFDIKHAVSVNSATSALIAAMGAIGLSPGDEVIVPPYTMSATAMAPLFYGGIPKFVDIEPNYFCLNADLVEKAITSKTKAIIAVNLFGHPAELIKLKRLADKHGLYLIEDNAQAILAKENNVYTGTIGHIGIFSLNIHKHIHTGEGGMLVTDDDDLALRLKLIRNHGENAIEWLNIEDISNLIGQNYRLGEINAAIGLAQLEKLESLVARCEEIGQGLSERLKGIPNLHIPKVREQCTHSYFMWTAQIDNALDRHCIVDALSAEGIPIASGYVKPLYRLPVFQKKMAIGSAGFPFDLSDVEYIPQDYPVVEHCHYSSVIQIQPVSWSMSSAQLDQIAQGFNKVFSQSLNQIVDFAPC